MAVDIEKLRSLEKLATPGPWEVTTSGGDNVMRAGRETLMSDTQYYPWPPDNLDDWHLIAALRNVAPDMLTEIEQLRAEAEEDEQLRNRMAELLTQTAAALNGDPPPLTLHGWSDLPKVAGEMRALLEKVCVDLELQGYTDWPAEIRDALRMLVRDPRASGEPST